MATSLFVPRAQPYVRIAHSPRRASSAGGPTPRWGRSLGGGTTRRVPFPLQPPPILRNIRGLRSGRRDVARSGQSFRNLPANGTRSRHQVQVVAICGIQIAHSFHEPMTRRTFNNAFFVRRRSHSDTSVSYRSARSSFVYTKLSRMEIRLDERTNVEQDRRRAAWEHG